MSRIIRKYWVIALVFLIMSLIFKVGFEYFQNSDKQPNVIIVMTDDQGYGDLSLHGNDSIFTPNIDQFAKDGIQFDRFYVSPVCAPTRASLLTGRYHLRTGTTWVTHRKEVMRSDEITIAEIFKTAGYTTGIFGKWHNGEQYPHHPNGQGFDEFYGFAAGHCNNYFDTPLEHNGKKVKTKGYITDVLTNKAIDFIKSNTDQPFLCYVPYNAPHSPFQVPDKYFDKYKKMGLTDKNACIYGMNENIDDNFGRIMQTLQDEGLEENTIIIFMTDNGPNGDRFNGNMKGRKAKVDEGGVRVPFFIRWKNHLPRGKIIKQLAAHIDILPTLMDLCGIENENHQPFDGKSLMPLLKNKNPNWQERNIYSIQNDGTWNNFPSSVRNNQYRLVKDHDQNILLYDMIKDFSQTNNIADKHPEIAKQLREDLENWFKEVTQNGIEPPLVEVGHSESSRVILPAPESQLSDDLQFEGGMGWANDWIKNWRSPDDYAEWNIYVIQTGIYNIKIEYTAAVNGAKVIIGENQISSVMDKIHQPPFLDSPDKVKRGEVYEKEWATHQIGRLQLEKGEHRLRLSFDMIPNHAEIHIKSLIIEDVSSEIKVN